MKTVNYAQIVNTVADLTSACSQIAPSCEKALQRALENEKNPNARFALETLIENAKTAREQDLPVCQDTGMSVFFVKLGQDVHIEGGLLTDAIDDGVRKGYKEHGYRASVLDPITRVNTKDNTPAIVHISLVLGDSLEITFLPKGFGSENMSRLFMLKPSDGVEGVKNAVVQAVKDAGANPCRRSWWALASAALPKRQWNLQKSSCSEKSGNIAMTKLLQIWRTNCLRVSTRLA